MRRWNPFRRVSFPLPTFLADADPKSNGRRAHEKKKSVNRLTECAVRFTCTHTLPPPSAARTFTGEFTKWDALHTEKGLEQKDEHRAESWLCEGEKGIQQSDKALASNNKKYSWKTRPWYLPTPPFTPPLFTASPHFVHSPFLIGGPMSPVIRLTGPVCPMVVANEVFFGNSSSVKDFGLGSVAECTVAREHWFGVFQIRQYCVLPTSRSRVCCTKSVGWFNTILPCCYTWYAVARARIPVVHSVRSKFVFQYCSCVKSRDTTRSRELQIAFLWCNLWFFSEFAQGRCRKNSAPSRYLCRLVPVRAVQPPRGSSREYLTSVYTVSKFAFGNKLVRYGLTSVYLLFSLSFAISYIKSRV